MPVSRTKHPEVFAALSDPFREAGEVKTRNQGGKRISYITARTAMIRLDEALGPECWQSKLKRTERGYVCELSITLDGGMTWITKTDVGGFAGMTEVDNDEKSAASDAFKRAAAQFGVARYLYNDGVPEFAEEAQPAENTPSPAPKAASHLQEPEDRSAPRTGRALFAWTKDQEQKHQVGLTKYINAWAKPQGFPDRFVDWSDEQVKLGHSWAVLKLDTLVHQSQEHPPEEVQDFPEPDGSIPRPRDGKGLFRLCKDYEDKHGVTTLRAINDWARQANVPGKLTEWAPADVGRGWRWFCHFAAERNRKMGRGPHHELKQALIARSREKMRLKDGRADLASEQDVGAEIRGLYAELYHAEMPCSVKDFGDEAVIREMIATQEESIREANLVGSGTY